MKRLFLSLTMLLFLSLSISISYSESTVLEIPKISITISDKTIDNSSLIYPVVMIDGAFYYPLTWDFSSALGFKTQFSHANGLSLIPVAPVSIPDRVLGTAVSLSNYRKANYKVTIDETVLSSSTNVFNIFGITYVGSDALVHLGKQIKYTHENGLVVSEIQTSSNLPTVFNTYDTLDATKLLRNQGTAATCWAFAANSMFEIAIAKQTNVYNDFSETHLIQYTTIPSTLESGGNFQASRIYYQNRFGPVDESTTLTTVVPSPYQLTGFAEINSDLTATKRAIFEYGSVLTSIYLNESDVAVYSKENTAYYNDSLKRQRTHELILVGWDNQYSKENFVTQPKKDGAFIAQNSFGNSWGDNGFFYISYEDVHLLNEVYAITKFQIKPVKENMYAYDETGITHFESFGDTNNAIGINTFKNKGNETLKNIGIYTAENNMSVEIFYANGKFNQKLSPVKFQITLEKKGYHIVELPLALQLNDSSYFWIGTLFKGTTSFVVPIEAPFPGVTYPITSNAGEGYIGNGEVFFDLNLFRKNANIALRAFTWPN